MYNTDILEIMGDVLDELRQDAIDWCSFVADMKTNPHDEHIPTDAELAEMEALF